MMFDPSNLCLTLLGLACSLRQSPIDANEKNDICSSRRSYLVNAILTGGVLLADRSICYGLSPEEASNAYDSYASSYNELDGGTASSLLGIGEARRKVLRKAKGNVLEIGAGTGLNLSSYIPSQLKSLTLVDISAVSYTHLRAHET